MHSTVCSRATQSRFCPLRSVYSSHYLCRILCFSSHCSVVCVHSASSAAMYLQWLLLFVSLSFGFQRMPSFPLDFTLAENTVDISTAVV